MGLISMKLYMAAVLILMGSIAIPYFYLNFIVPKNFSYNYTMAPELEHIPNENNLLILNSTSYSQMISNSRQHAAFIVFTALGPEFSCTPCKSIQTSLGHLANSWLSQNPQYPLFFSYLDASNGMEVFRKLKIDGVPLILLYLPLKGEFSIPEGSESKLNFLRSNPESLSADSMAHWISTSTKQTFNYKTPPNFYLSLVVSILTFIGLICMRWVFPIVYKILSSRTVWLVSSIVG
ncbi:oligosaccharyl transferase subunit ost3/OST6, partial [Coelomomyces lativittatus]